MNISSAQYAEMLSRLNRNDIRIPKNSETGEREPNLPDQIVSFCWVRRRLYACARIDKWHTSAVGAPAR